MANRRAIDSNIWDDDWFGQLSDRAQLLWIGLFSRMADDQGRIADNPVLIGRKIFPYKEIPSDEIDGYISELGSHIIRYEVNGKRYIQIVKWWENQPMQYATPSCFPAPDGWKDRYRTNYKKTYIVFNWSGQPNTQAGINLYSKLIGLGRVSSWTDYVEPLNYNPTPTPTPNSGSKEDAPEKQKIPDEPEETASPSYPIKPEIAIVREVTGLIPDYSSEAKVINNIQACRKRLGQPPKDVLLTELKTAWDNWRESKTKDGRPYNPANWDWTERAATGFYPKPSTNGNGKAAIPASPVDTMAELELTRQRTREMMRKAEQEAADATD